MLIHRREQLRHLGRVCHEAQRKIDLREHYLSLAQAVYAVDRLFPDRQQRTANIVHHQVESQSHQPQRDSGSALLSAVDRPCEPSYERWIEPDQHQKPQETKQYSKEIIQRDGAEY